LLEPRAETLASGLCDEVASHSQRGNSPQNHLQESTTVGLDPRPREACREDSPQHRHSMRAARVSAEDGFKVAVARRRMDALRPVRKPRTPPGSDGERIDEHGSEQNRPRKKSARHRTARGRALHAVERSDGMSAVDAKASDPVSRTIGFAEASLVIGSVGKAHVTHVKAAIAKPKTSAA